MTILNILTDLNHLSNLHAKEESRPENFDFYGRFPDAIHVKVYKHNGKKPCLSVMSVRLIHNAKTRKLVFRLYILLSDLAS